MGQSIVVLLLNSLAYCISTGNLSIPQQQQQHLKPCHYTDLTTELPHLDECISHVKSLAGDQTQFWFGVNWKPQCSSNSLHKNTNMIKCYNPSDLQRYTSLGSRLLRVITFDPLYLKNLEIFPRVVFDSEPGQYTACDHTFRSSVPTTTYGHPDMTPALPWDLRKQPVITWPGIAPEAFYITVLLDVGFGQLLYLAQDYPHNTKVLKAYNGPQNFRAEVNPYAVVVIRQPLGLSTQVIWREALDESSGMFNLQKFIMDNNFQQSVVGLNWIRVSTDAYAMEAQRQLKFVDNCPSLIREALDSFAEAKQLSFLPPQAITDVNVWLSVVYEVGAFGFVVCCEDYSIQQSSLTLDPLGSTELSPVLIRAEPTLSVSHAAQNDYFNYRRSNRDYFIATLDKSLYTVLMVHVPLDGTEVAKPTVHWLVVNIPFTGLSKLHLARSVQQDNTEEAGKALLSYKGPLPEQTDSTNRYMFVLFKQSAYITQYESHLFTPDDCSRGYRGRCRFDVIALMSRYSLTLSGASWFYAHKDPYVLYEQVRWGFLETQVCKGRANYPKSCHQRAAAVKQISVAHRQSCSILWHCLLLVFMLSMCRLMYV